MEWSRKTVNGIAYYDNDCAGDGSAPVVFIHGVGLRAESWQYQLGGFTNQRRCYAIDMPGHGASDLLPITEINLKHFAAAVSDFINTVVGKPAIIVGHSLGAMTALQLAVSYPALVQGVAALNAIYERSDSAIADVQKRATSLLQNMEQDVSARPVERWFVNNPQYQTAADLCRTWLENGNRLGYARAYQMFAQLRGIEPAQLQQIGCPALLLTGELDANSSPEMSEAMADIIPHATAIIVPDARHMTQMTHVDAVNQALANFFKQCDAYHVCQA